jgi:hypothetical protein
MDTKKCIDCGEEKAINEFCKHKNCAQGYRNQCAMCNRIMQKKRYENKHKELIEKKRKYYNENKDIINKKRMENYHLKRDSYLESRRKYEKKNKDRVIEWKRNYNENNKGRILELARARFEKKDKEEKRAMYRKDAEKRKNSVQYKMRSSCSGRIAYALKKYGKVKSDRTEHLLGCSIAFFIKHIESQFTEGMCWESYGKYGWHVDHIYPCAAFDLTKESELRKCFHYSNHQPLWAFDNLSKHANILTEKPIFTSCL